MTYLISDITAPAIYPGSCFNYRLFKSLQACKTTFMKTILLSRSSDRVSGTGKSAKDLVLESVKAGRSNDEIIHVFAQEDNEPSELDGIRIPFRRFNTIEAQLFSLLPELINTHKVVKPKEKVLLVNCSLPFLRPETLDLFRVKSLLSRFTVSGTSGYRFSAVSVENPYKVVPNYVLSPHVLCVNPEATHNAVQVIDLDPIQKLSTRDPFELFMVNAIQSRFQKAIYANTLGFKQPYVSANTTEK